MGRLRVVSGLVVGLTAACGGVGNSPLVGDAGPDSLGVDTGPHSHPDSGTDSGTRHDSGRDSGTDSGHDSGSDSGFDSGSPKDGSSEADVGPSGCDGGLKACSGKCVDEGSDPKNCGGCGVICNTTCTGGICPLFGPDSGAPPIVADFACLTVDATNVYWGTGLAAGSGGSVWKVPIAGGAPTQMIGSQDEPHGMASDGTTLFYANRGAVAGTGSVEAIPIGGSVATPIASAQAAPLSVAVDAKNVYWTNSGDGSVWQSDKKTPSPIKLAGPNGMNHANNLVVDATNVYFTDSTTGVVNRVPIGGGSTTAMTTSGLNVSFLAVDAKNVYFDYFGASPKISSVAIGATSATPATVLSGPATTAGLQTDGIDLWFAVPSNVSPYMSGTGEIHRATVAGGADTVLASKQNGPSCISVDATSVYWIVTGGGLISKTGK